MTVRRIPQQERSKAMLDRIKLAGMEVLAKTGRDRFNLADVAVEAEVAIGSVYRYYLDRVEMLEDIQPIPGGLDLFIQEFLPAHAAVQGFHAAMENRRRFVEGCETCEHRRDGGVVPPHDPSPACESGGKLHCSCDTCF